MRIKTGLIMKLFERNKVLPQKEERSKEHLLRIFMCQVLCSKFIHILSYLILRTPLTGDRDHL